MVQRRSPLDRPLVLDVALGVVVGAALSGLAVQVRTVAAIRTLEATGRLSLAAAALLFTVLYWVETSTVLRSTEHEDDQASGMRSPTHALSTAVALGVVALLALVVAFATVENMGWFLGASALLWAIDLLALVILRTRGDSEPQAVRFLLSYSAINLLLFAALATWNGLAPWGERFRAGVAIALLAYVLFRHLVWRQRGLAAGRA